MGSRPVFKNFSERKFFVSPPENSLMMNIGNMALGDMVYIAVVIILIAYLTYVLFNPTKF